MSELKERNCKEKKREFYLAVEEKEDIPEEDVVPEPEGPSDDELRNTAAIDALKRQKKESATLKATVRQ